MGSRASLSRPDEDVWAYVGWRFSLVIPSEARNLLFGSIYMLGTGYRVLPRHFLLMLFKIFFRSCRPPYSHLHRLANPRRLRGIFSALVESHDNVGPESDLGFRGAFRAEKMRRP